MVSKVMSFGKPVNSILVLSGFIVVSFAASSGGLVFRPGQWYERLEKPSWRPPNWLFAPVWTFLYATIAIAGWLVWRQAGVEGAQLPLIVYAIQLLLNAAWSPIFFGLHQIGWALLEMALMWLSIVATIVLFYPISAGAAFLLVPYLCWVSFALVLNYSVWQLNGNNA
ncbi:TspO/MBR family protein [Ochrobactrum sp. MC-1LL]|jgi:tryptophan-rich sensory protein|uniref:TspO/MBR family protein n=1 Tax=Ochrobactrum sp. MC-1LL TaxID=2735351 RepID=UPI0025701A41|nr:TspO/MBR family protein [Ochrobactrum sp. MC-1LL]